MPNKRAQDFRGCAILLLSGSLTPLADRIIDRPGWAEGHHPHRLEFGQHERDITQRGPHILLSGYLWILAELHEPQEVYNDGAFENFTSKKAAPDALLWLEHGKPIVYAKGTKGLRLNRATLALEVVPVPDGNVEGLDILVHDETNKTIAQLLLDMPFGEFPIALGVLYCDPAPAFDTSVVEQNSKAAAGKKRDLNALLRKGDTWSVEPNAPPTDA